LTIISNESSNRHNITCFFCSYYLPFDKADKLKKFLEKKFNSGELIVLDKVYEESGRVAKGIVTKELDFLDDKKKLVKTDLILPPQKFFNRLENELCYGTQRYKLTSTEYEIEQKRFLETADAKLILFCEKDKHSLELDKPILVTEETRAENDGKLFKKLPEICTILNIEYCNLPTLLRDHFQINLSEYLK
jgi:hypothetical protein